MNSGTSYEDNPFEELETAKAWIHIAEQEHEGKRAKYIFPLLQKWVTEISGDTVLDVGAGQGIVSTFFKSKEYVGLEPSEELIRRAREKYSECGEFVKGTVYDMPFADNTFDAVFSVNVWFHLADLPKASKEFGRVLRSGGNFLIVTPDPDSYDIWQIFYRDIKFDGNKFEGQAHVPGGILPRNIFYMHTENEILDALELAGLELTSSEPLGPMENFDQRPLFRSYSGVKRAL